MSALWNQAALHWRNYQTPKPRVTHGPVGRQIDAGSLTLNDSEINRPTPKRIWFADGECSCCAGCGYHVCSCKRPSSAPYPVGTKLTPDQAAEHLSAGGYLLGDYRSQGHDLFRLCNGKAQWFSTYAKRWCDFGDGWEECLNYTHHTWTVADPNEVQP